MATTGFEVLPIGGNCYTINDRGRTVAVVTSRGYIDWLLKSPLQEGALLRSIRKETHLSYTLGLKLLLITPTPATHLTRFYWELGPSGAWLTLHGEAATPDGAFGSHTTAILEADDRLSRYEWQMTTTLTCTASTPQHLRWLEYNNVYPGKAGLCFLYQRWKEYDCTLLVDREGVVWKFPHQHLMHYGGGGNGKLHQLHFAPGTLGGFFGETHGSPVVIVHESSWEPDWAICDMYYDLHCGARPPGPIAPGQTLAFRYTIKYLGQDESAELLARARPIPVTDADRRIHDYPRLDLGLNTFVDNARIDRADEASGFRPHPPQRIWDRQVGHRSKGSLRISNERPEVTVWTAEPPGNIPPEHRLCIRGMIKTQGVTGKGMFLRVRYLTYQWHPTPHIEWVKDLESPAVNGTSGGWVQVAVPPLVVPPTHFDYLVQIDVVLDGQGVAWLTEVDVDLQPVPVPPPALEEGTTRKGKRAARGRGGRRPRAASLATGGVAD